MFVLFMSIAAYLPLGMLPQEAFSQGLGTASATCIRAEDKEEPFRADGFAEIHNAHIVSEREIAFFEEDFQTTRKPNGDSWVRAEVVSTEIPQQLADDYTISRVVIEKELSSTNCYCNDCEHIEIQIALDCKTCTKNSSGLVSCAYNNHPQWISLEHPPSAPRMYMTEGPNRFEIDTLSIGFVGTHLCWRGIFREDTRKIESPNCMRFLKKLSIGYQAVKSGEYTRSSPMPIANMAFISSYTTPKSQFDTEASTRLVTGLKDYTRRGMVRAYELYNPEKPKETTKKLKWSLKSGLSNPGTLDYGGVRFHNKGPMQTQGSWAPVATDVFDDFFSQSRLKSCTTPLGIQLYDLNQSNSCTQADALALQNWLIGVDADAARAQGAIPTAFELSTPAIFTNSPIVYPPWVRLASQTEIENYRRWKAELTRPELAFLLLGSTTGEIYGIDAGLYVAAENDGCLKSVQHHRGYFKPYPGCPKEEGSLKRYTGELPGNPSAGKVKTVYYPWLFRQNCLFEYNTRYYGTPHQQAYSIFRPSLNASVAFMDVDFMSPRGNALPEFEDASKPLAWEYVDSGQGYRAKGPHSLIVLSSGPSRSLLQVLFIGANSEKPNENPRLYYLWELDFEADLRVKDHNLKAPLYNKPSFGTKSSRHAPLVGRFMFNRVTNPLPAGVAKWLAIVGSDYKPGLDSDEISKAGVVFLVDVYTGELLKLTPQIPGSDWGGFVLLERGEGVGGEIVGLDLQHQSIDRPKPDPDGIYDVIYIPTTLGRVYRVNLLKYNPSSNAAYYGDAYGKCKVIDLPEIVKGFGASDEEAKRQGIHSNMAVYQKGKKVYIYVGTADNPDIYDKKIDPPAENYHMFAFELDESSVGTAACAPAKLLWAKKLPAGEKVWGGISVNPKEVVVGTATGGSSDICGLNAETEGHIYVLAAETGEILQSKEAQVVASPVAFDGHFLYVDARSHLESLASAGINSWNNSPATMPLTTPPAMKILNQTFEQDIRREKAPK